MKKPKLLTDFALTKKEARLAMMPYSQMPESAKNDTRITTARVALQEFCSQPGSDVTDDYLMTMLRGHDPHGVLRDRSEDEVHEALLADLDARTGRALGEFTRMLSAEAAPSLQDQVLIVHRASDNLYSEMAQVLDEMEAATLEERWGKARDLARISHWLASYISLFTARMSELNEEVDLIIKKHQLPSPTADRGTHLTDSDKLRLEWERLDKTACRYLRQSYLERPQADDHAAVVRESVAYALGQVSQLRKRKENDPEDLWNNLYMAQIIIKGADAALGDYRKRGIHAIDLNTLHHSEDGTGFWHLKHLSKYQRGEIAAPPDGGQVPPTTDFQACREACAKDDYQCIARSEIRAMGTGKAKDKKRIVGFVPFDSESENLGGFTEILKPGAFAHALGKGTEIRSLWQHQMDKPLGTTQNASLEVHESPTGLHYTVYPNMRTSYGKDAYESVSRGDVHATSFGFKVLPAGEKWRNKANGAPLREILNIDTLLEVSPVTFPAYPATVAIAKEGEL